MVDDDGGIISLDTVPAPKGNGPFGVAALATVATAVAKNAVDRSDQFVEALRHRGAAVADSEPGSDHERAPSAAGQAIGDRELSGVDRSRQRRGRTAALSVPSDGLGRRRSPRLAATVLHSPGRAEAADPVHAGGHT